MLDEHNVVQPDILFVSNARSAALRDANVVGAPDVCVEVLSPGTERIDRTRKLELYARFGVPHYWIVDVDARAIEGYVLEIGAYALPGVSGPNDTFRPAALPGFEFRMTDVPLPD